MVYKRFDIRLIALTILVPPKLAADHGESERALAVTGWFFSAPYSFDGTSRDIALCIFHPNLNDKKESLLAFQAGTIEFMGMADVAEADRNRVIVRWRQAFQAQYEPTGVDGIRPFLTQVFEEASEISDEVSATFTAAISDLNGSRFI